MIIFASWKKVEIYESKDWRNHAALRSSMRIMQRRKEDYNPEGNLL
jgi:hypothetical protein